MKNHTSLIISRYTQNTGKLLDQVIVIRKTPDPLRKTPDLLRKTPDPLRKTPDPLRKTPDPIRKTVSYPFSFSYSFSISYSFFFPLALKNAQPLFYSSVSCRTGSLKKGRIHPAAVAANELCHGQLLGNNLVIPSRSRTRSRFLTLSSFSPNPLPSAENQ